MFDQTSRYYNSATTTLMLTDSNGIQREIRYVQRRFVPSATGLTTLVQHTVMQGERLDNITAHYMGDPTQYWRICDANNVLDPNELTDEAGYVITIAMPKL
jgi:hypothetical protein